MAIPNNLQELAEQIGFGRAFAKTFSDLPEDIWEELSFRQCVDICLTTNSDKLRLKATRQMKAIGSFDDWRNGLYAPLRQKVKLLLVAVLHMARLAAKSKKPNEIRRVMLDAFAIGRLLKQFNQIGGRAKHRLAKHTGTQDQ